jgi:hypothetical protein
MLFTESMKAFNWINVSFFNVRINVYITIKLHFPFQLDSTSGLGLV